MSRDREDHSQLDRIELELLNQQKLLIVILEFLSQGQGGHHHPKYNKSVGATVKQVDS
jgi:hypothetical protein